MKLTSHKVYWHSKSSFLYIYFQVILFTFTKCYHHTLPGACVLFLLTVAASFSNKQWHFEERSGEDILSLITVLIHPKIVHLSLLTEICMCVCVRERDRSVLFKDTQLVRLYSTDEECIYEYGALVEWYWQRTTEILGDNHVPVQICPPHISHGLAWDCTWISTVRSQWQTVWNMPQLTEVWMEEYYLFIFILLVDMRADLMEGNIVFNIHPHKWQNKVFFWPNSVRIHIFG